MYCTIHQTVNYPNVKFFRADENGERIIQVTHTGAIFKELTAAFLHATVNDPMHGTVANREDLLDLEGFVRKCIAAGHTEL